ncbi:hypothetical protein DIPPA_35977 [Diplonema papillatum]|nr:hypothetical protein DIPPA_35977 [Diplonema papillatum]
MRRGWCRAEHPAVHRQAPAASLPENLEPANDAKPPSSSADDEIAPASPHFDIYKYRDAQLLAVAQAQGLLPDADESQSLQPEVTRQSLSERTSTNSNLCSARLGRSEKGEKKEKSGDSTFKSSSSPVNAEGVMSSRAPSRASAGSQAPAASLPENPEPTNDAKPPSSSADDEIAPASPHFDIYKYRDAQLLAVAQTQGLLPDADESQSLQPEVTRQSLSERTSTNSNLCSARLGRSEKGVRRPLRTTKYPLPTQS